jgi:hypothetical protein
VNNNILQYKLEKNILDNKKKIMISGTLLLSCTGAKHTLKKLYKVLIKVADGSKKKYHEDSDYCSRSKGFRD